MPSPKDTKGPIVKTGPTAGQVRSKNSDGKWRKKRSDAGTTRSSSDVSADDLMNIMKSLKNAFKK